MSKKIASLHAEIGADTRGIDSALKSTKSGLAGAAKSMAGYAAVAAAAGYAIKQAWEFGKQGAELEFVTNKFERLSDSIGTVSDDLMGDLRRATRGLYSDAQLAASATDFMSLGLAKSHDEVVRLSSVASALNMNMNQLVLTLTNKTTMRFDSLGVAVDGFDEKVEKLKRTGLDADAAFNEAFLQQAEEQIERVGHAADSNVGSVMRMEASWANLTNTLKVKAAPVIADVADGISEHLNMLSVYDEKYAELTEGIGFFGNALEEQAAAQLYARGITRELNSDIDSATRSYIAWGNSIEVTNDKIEEGTASTERMVTSYAGILGITNSLQGSSDRFNEQQEDTTKKTDEVLAKIVELTEKGYGRWGEEIQGLLKDYDDLNAAMAENASNYERDTQRRILERAKELMSADGLSEAEEKYLIDRGVAMGVYTQEVAMQSRRIIDDAASIAAGFDMLDGRVVTTTVLANFISSFGGVMPGGNEDILGGANFGGPVPTENYVNPNQLRNNGGNRGVTVNIGNVNNNSDINYLAQELFRSATGSGR